MGKYKNAIKFTIFIPPLEGKTAISLHFDTSNPMVSRYVNMVHFATLFTIPTYRKINQSLPFCAVHHDGPYFLYAAKRVSR